MPRLVDLSSSIKIWEFLFSVYINQVNGQKIIDGLGLQLMNKLPLSEKVENALVELFIVTFIDFINDSLHSLISPSLTL